MGSGPLLPDSFCGRVRKIAKIIAIARDVLSQGKKSQGSLGGKDTFGTPKVFRLD